MNTAGHQAGLDIRLVLIMITVSYLNQLRQLFPAPALILYTVSLLYLQFQLVKCKTPESQSIPEIVYSVNYKQGKGYD